MCLAIPAKITDIANGVATCRVGESDTSLQCNLMLLDGEAKIDDYLIVHAGFALRILDPLEAEQTLGLLREMVAATGEVAGF